MPHPPAASRDNKDRLARLLHAGHELALDTIAEELGVTPRQARRTVRALQAEGLPIRTRRDGRYKLHFLAEADRTVPTRPVALTEREALALAVAAEAAGAVLAPTPLAAALAAARDKLLASADVYSFEPEAAGAHWHFGGTAVPVDDDVFETVRQAVADRRRLSISYVNAAGDRSEGRLVDPYVVAVVGGSWLLVARDHRRDMLLHFALPAIEVAEPGDFFDPDPAFDPHTHFREAFGAFAGGEVETVRLRVAPEAAASFRRKAYHPTQIVEEEGADGGLIVSFEVPFNPALAAFVRSFGPAVHVLAPAALADTVAADAAAVAALYGERDPHPVETR